LADLTGLDRVTYIGRGLTVSDNASLSSLTGLGKVTTISRTLTVTDNPTLCADEVTTLVAQLLSFTGTVTASGNAGTCP
jgi:excinuclease UvrABC helicase subunit UvrB